MIIPGYGQFIEIANHFGILGVGLRGRGDGGLFFLDFQPLRMDLGFWSFDQMISTYEQGLGYMLPATGSVDMRRSCCCMSRRSIGFP